MNLKPGAKPGQAQGRTDTGPLSSSLNPDGANASYPGPALKSPTLLKGYPMNVGFIGLGNMGSGMASNIARTDADLMVFDPVEAAVARLTDQGARAASNIAELARECEVIFTSLPGPAQVEEVALGAGGIAENMAPRTTLFDLSTSSVSLARRIHDEFLQRGSEMLDAPVSGGPAGAASGDLVIWVGGNRDIFDRHLELLGALARTPRHVGPIGAGTVTKLVHNTIGYTVMLSLAEGFSVAVRAGLDPLELWEALRLGMACKGSPLDLLVKQFLPSKYEPPAFALKLAHKDVTLATAMSREYGIATRLADATLAEMTEAIANGLGDQDSRAFLKLQLERAGVEIAVDAVSLAEAVARVRDA